MIGQKFSHYRIIEQIGAGGMGVVYRAHDEQLDRDVAVKVLPPGTLGDETARRRFRQEALSLAKLNHPGIATVHEFNSQGGTDFLVTEYIPGITLDRKLAGGALPAKEVIALGLQLAHGLAAAHEQGIVHRDLKPANLRLTPEGRLKILDFGLARLMPHTSDLGLTATLTQSQEVTGTLPYMAPEQLRGEPSNARTDVWAAGAVLYEMATGRRPFRESNSPLLINSILNQKPESPSKLNTKISPGLENVILKALNKDPARRHQTAQELGQELTKALTGEAVVSSRRVGKKTALALTLLLLAAIFTFTSYTHHLWPRHEGVVAPASAPIRTRRSVAVLGFKNLSKRPETDWISTALAETLTTELAAGEQLRTIPGEDVARVKISLSLADADSYSADTLGRIRKNLGADYVVLGSYLDLGKESEGRVRLDLRLQDAGAGEMVAAVSETGSEAQLPDLVSRTGAVLRAKLGVSEVSATEAAMVRAALPANPEVARLYSEGLAKLRAFDYQAGRDLLQKAIAADPGYPLAHLALSLAWEKLGQKEQVSYKLWTAREKISGEEAKRAFELSASLSREDRLWVEAQYRKTMKEFDKAIGIYRTLFSLFPDNVDYGLALADAQDGKDTLATLEVLRKLPDPTRDDPRIDYSEAEAANRTGDFRRAQAAADRAANKGNARGARLLVADARSLECHVFLRLAQPKQARASCEQARQVYAEVSDRGSLAKVLRRIARARHQEGDFGGAKRTFEEALALSRQIGSDRGVVETLSELSSILSAQGDLAGAKRRLGELLATDRKMGWEGHPEITLGRMAAVLTLQGDLAGAKRRLQEALPTDIGPADLQAARDLVDLAHILYLQGDLDGARKRLNEALPVIQGAPAIFGGDDVFTRWLELSFLLSNTELSIEEGHPSDAEALVRQAIAKFRASADVNPFFDSWDIWETQVGAETRLARTLVAVGRVAEARKEIDSVKELMANGQSRRRRLEYAVVAARIFAASGQPTEAKRNLEGALAEATKYGFVGYQFEARLALGEIDMRSGEVAAGGVRLAALEKDATAKGFLLIAHKAAAAR